MHDIHKPNGEHVTGPTRPGFPKMVTTTSTKLEFPTLDAEFIGNRERIELLRETSPLKNTALRDSILVDLLQCMDVSCHYAQLTQTRVLKDREAIAMNTNRRNAIRLYEMLGVSDVKEPESDSGLDLGDEDEA